MDISNSEIETEQTCQRRHYYGFGLGLQGKRLSRPLQIGLFGHSILEHFYTILKDTRQVHVAYPSTLEHLSNMDLTDPIVVDVTDRFIRYAKQYMHDDFADFEIDSVEKLETIPIGDDINYRFTADLLVKLKHDMEVELASGAWVTFPQDSYIVIDHKFVGQPFTFQKLMMNVQLPKYMHALRMLGYPVVGAMVNQISYTSKLLQRDWLSPSDTRILNIMDENSKAARRIATHKKLPVSEYRNVAERSFSVMNCERCAFRLPCSIELNGGDATRILVNDFKENPYVNRTKVAQ